MRWILILLTSLTLTLHAEEAKKAEPLTEEVSETLHSINLDGTTLSYKATAGNLILKDKEGKDKASIFYVAYTKEGVDNLSNRPVTFCFNGGPGSSSIWLHLGAFGPQRVNINGTEFDPPPYDLIDNPHTLLDVTDLVFIDPVSTGYSQPAPGEDAKQFHGVKEDVASVAQFIRQWTTRNGRWESPKFLAGESYGSTRAAALADYLHDTYGMYINGVILISTALDFNVIVTDSFGNDLPYILSLPSYALTAWHYNLLDPELQNLSQEELLDQVEAYALSDYASALMLGSRISPEQRARTIETLHRFTSIDPTLIDRANLRININLIGKNLLHSDQKTIGRFDGRVNGFNIDNINSNRDYDPSFESVSGAFTAAFNQYISRDLNWKTDDEYKVLTNVRPWNFSNGSPTTLNTSPNLRQVMIKNPTLRVFVGNGYYDLATPYFATEYTFDHLNLPEPLNSNITLTYYPGGHMMYTDLSNLAQLKKDLAAFIAP